MQNKLVTIVSAIQYWSEIQPQSCAVRIFNKDITYRELSQRTTQCALYLKSKGIKKNDVVASQIKDPFISLLVCISLEAIGAIRVAQYDEKILSEKCDFVLYDSDKFFDSEKFISISNEKLSQFSNENLSINYAILNIQPDEKDIIFISSTSGTTGNKKYYAETYGGIWENFSLMRDLYFKDKINNFICSYPMSVSAGYAGCYIALNVGGIVKFQTIKDIFDKPEDNHTSHVALIPRDLIELRKNYLNFCLENKVGSVRGLGSHLSIDLRNWLENNFAEKVFNSYSSNETGQIGEVMPTGWVKIYPNVKVKIVSEDWDDLGTNSDGFICVNSKQLVQNYLWNEELNQTHFRDGWYKTNDIGRLNNNNELIILDRNDNMLILDGIKVPPSPIEDEVKKIKGISDAAVIDIKNDTLGASVILCISIESTFDKKSAYNYLYQIVKRFTFNKYPVYIFEFDKLPTTDNGKIQKNLLKDICKKQLLNL